MIEFNKTAGDAEIDTSKINPVPEIFKEVLREVFR
jgi:hypothetical protein